MLFGIVLAVTIGAFIIYCAIDAYEQGMKRTVENARAELEGGSKC